MKKKNFLNSIRRPFLQIVTGALCLHSLSTFGQSETANNEDKTLSPYFVVISDESENPKLPLKSTYADVNITGVIADVKVTQEYQNTGTTAIEAIYVFP